MNLPEAIAATRKYTMLSGSGFETLHNIVQGVTVPGAIVECGVASGGCAAFLWAISGSNRHLWMFDSWQGLPRPDENDGGRAAAKHFHRMIATGGAWCKGELTDVIWVLNAVGCPLDLMHFCPGWFHETLPENAHRIGDIAILHLDGDFYESTVIPLKWLWQYVVPGGVVIVDDYDAWEGCKKAVDEFCFNEGASIENGVIYK